MGEIAASRAIAELQPSMRWPGRGRSFRSVRCWSINYVTDDTMRQALGKEQTCPLSLEQMTIDRGLVHVINRSYAQRHCADRADWPDMTSGHGRSDGQTVIDNFCG